MTNESIDIRKASPEEAPFLSKLALRSKAYWGYSEEFLAACTDELTIDPQAMSREGFHCFLAASGSSVLGFYAMRQVQIGEFELDALFVEPEHIGNGIGRSLVRHAVYTLSRHGGGRLTIQGDPNAAKFYVSVGARPAGERESESIPGRFLPLFEIDVDSC